MLSLLPLVDSELAARGSVSGCCPRRQPATTWNRTTRAMQEERAAGLRMPDCLDDGKKLGCIDEDGTNSGSNRVIDAFVYKRNGRDRQHGTMADATSRVTRWSLLHGRDLQSNGGRQLRP
jgi:hypothetical protein